jgi:kynurenine formamidase
LPKLTCSEWSKAGGIAGRGVLLDYVAYAQRHNIKYPTTGRHAITYKDLDAIAKEQKVEFKPGDLLLVRTGYVKWHNDASHEERLRGTAIHEYCGVEGDKECIEWMWEHHFAAVASDSPAFETVPPKDTLYSAYRDILELTELLVLHNFLIAFWGTPIGELWDLEELARLCEKNQRWSFFLTSAPLNVEGGVGSPCNALAVF